jgi:hypothetical protein
MGQPKAAPDVSVLILGVYHMANPKLDLVQSEIRDTLGADRQKEIVELVSRIAKFNPTKVLVESVAPADSLSQAYQQYVNGSHTLARDEREQVGFRLAKQLGHKRLFPVDAKMDMDFQGLMGAAAKQNKTAFLKRMQEVPPKIGKMLEDLDKRHTVAEILAAMNSPFGLWASHSLYMEFLDVDNGQEFAGSDVVAGWYSRNLRIFSNMKRLAEPGDRLLVIYGAGHAKLLSDFVKDTKGWQLQDPMKFLPKPPKVDWNF